MNGTHPWLLTAPWYRWQQPGVPAYGRGTGPLLQKYAAASFVTDFLQEPQRSLVFTDEDFVYRVEAKVPRPKYSLSSLVRVPTERRKVFLDVHSRFYLVVCELHCDAPGLPTVTRNQVCGAGLVVRRRVAPAPPVARKVLAAALEEVTTIEARVAKLERQMPVYRASGAAPGVAIARASGTCCQEEIASQRGKLAASQARLQELAASFGVTLELQGWVPGAHKGIGAWQSVEETPAQLTEEVFPLYPLIPDPAVADHSARDRTLYFAVLPTGSSDVDALANPRFDDRSLYEVRCFVRRPKLGCPQGGRHRNCKGPIVWSRPSEVYQLAATGDLDGTSHKPVTIQLPDLQALEAQAAAQHVGQGVGVRLVSPGNSSLEFQTDGDGKPINGQVGGASICSFAIPLITIVATFVLKLFLPIVVFLFGLWWMLKLKFCILPSFELDAGLAASLAASLAATPPGVDLSVGIKTAFEHNLGADAAAGLEAQYGGDVNVLGALALDMGTDFSQDAPAALAADFDPPRPNVGGPKRPLPSLTAGLEYYARVEMPA